MISRITHLNIFISIKTFCDHGLLLGINQSLLCKLDILNAFNRELLFWAIHPAHAFNPWAVITNVFHLGALPRSNVCRIVTRLHVKPQRFVAQSIDFNNSFPSPRLQDDLFIRYPVQSHSAVSQLDTTVMILTKSFSHNVTSCSVHRGCCKFCTGNSCAYGKDFSPSENQLTRKRPIS